jgi:hypothetical protein
MEFHLFFLEQRFASLLFCFDFSLWRVLIGRVLDVWNLDVPVSFDFGWDVFWGTSSCLSYILLGDRLSWNDLIIWRYLFSSWVSWGIVSVRRIVPEHIKLQQCDSWVSFASLNCGCFSSLSCSQGRVTRSYYSTVNFWLPAAIIVRWTFKSYGGLLRIMVDFLEIDNNSKIY